MKIGYVVCSRLKSERLPNKVFKKINGLPVIKHLIKRLENYPVILAVPKEEAKAYEFLREPNVFIYADDNADDPLKRMSLAAQYFNLDLVIRVTHDKIFVDYKEVEILLNYLIKQNLDYCYSSKFIPGTGFEVIRTSALITAANKYEKVEYIGLAIKSITEKYFNVPIKNQNKNSKRLLIDYPEDLHLMELIFSVLGDDSGKSEVCKFLDENEEFLKINYHPLISVYTCAHNAGEWIEQAMKSVKTQSEFKFLEYILIDDFSTDSTLEKMYRFSLQHNNVKVFKNDENLGLASSSNVALKKARGKYIIRLDADDFFTRADALKLLVKEIEKQSCDVVYPDNWFGCTRRALNNTQKGSEQHHVGGALFNRDAINHLKFTEGLRHHDSLDIFLKAKGFLKLGYLKTPVFFYRQHEKSMSKSDLPTRLKIKEQLLKESRV